MVQATDSSGPTGALNWQQAARKATDTLWSFTRDTGDLSYRGKKFIDFARVALFMGWSMLS
jgi:hypothetical protein